MKNFTISNIEERWIKEAKSPEITELDEEFYERAGAYATEISREIKQSEDLRKELLQEELKHVVNFVQEIYFFRILKITDSLFREKEKNLLNQENQAFENIRGSLRNLKEELVSPVLNREPKIKPPKKASHVLVMIKAEIPTAITGSDIRNYGPFKKGEIANLPKKTAELLVKQNLAKRIEYSELFDSS